jgi:hypothetical protein
VSANECPHFVRHIPNYDVRLFFARVVTLAFASLSSFSSLFRFFLLLDSISATHFFIRSRPSEIRRNAIDGDCPVPLSTEPRRVFIKDQEGASASVCFCGSKAAAGEAVQTVAQRVEPRTFRTGNAKSTQRR